jgi:branched-chain amino acid transport system ATP-binding protein
MLDIEQVDVRFGEVKVLASVSLTVRSGETVSLIGVNGAGKTTLLKTISGLVRPAAGRIDFFGKSLVNVSPDLIVRRGIAHVPEGRRIFPQLTVDENLKVGAHVVPDGRSIRSRLERVYALFPRLRERWMQLGHSLSGGEQQMLALGRAMMSNPKLLLLDEPSLGLAPLIIAELANTIAKFRHEGISVLLVEQNANLALALSQRGYLLERGQISLTESSANLRKNPKVIESYLGGLQGVESRERMSGHGACG